MSALLQAAIWSGAATLVVLAVSRFWRRDDGALWHAVWVAVAAASVMMPVATFALPHLLVAVASHGPATRVATAGITGVAAASWLAAAYVAGLGWALFRLVSGVQMVRRVCRHSEAVEGVLLVRLRQCAAVAPGVVRTHRRVQVPLAAGLVRPVVLLPAAWMAWDTDRLSAVLRHELAHVARRDYGWNLLALAFGAMFWFSPLAWIVSRRIKLTAELAADRTASDSMDRVSYARILIQSARELVAVRSGGLLAPGAATALDARIAALTSRAAVTVPTSTATRAVVVFAVLILLLTGAVVRVQVLPAAGFGGSGNHQARHTH